jgi:hypothetical protein
LQNEITDLKNSGSFCPDAAISDDKKAVHVAAERSDHGTGRVYLIYFEATNTQGNSCTGTVSVCVPKDGQTLTCPNAVRSAATYAVTKDALFCAVQAPVVSMDK